jgi:hypothetical protein
VKLFSKPESKFESEGLVSLVVKVIVRIILLRMTNGCYRSYTSLRGLTLVQLPFKLQRYRNEEQVRPAWGQFAHSNASNVYLDAARVYLHPRYRYYVNKNAPISKFIQVGLTSRPSLLWYVTYIAGSYAGVTNVAS